VHINTSIVPVYMYVCVRVCVCEYTATRSKHGVGDGGRSPGDWESAARHERFRPPATHLRSLSHSRAKSENPSTAGGALQGQEASGRVRRDQEREGRGSRYCLRYIASASAAGVIPKQSTARQPTRGGCRARRGGHHTTLVVSPRELNKKIRHFSFRRESNAYPQGLQSA